jgi:hypothetical protein
MPRRRLKIDAVNELSMTERETILGLLRLGWSERRIAREGGHHRATVRRIRHEAGLPAAKCTSPGEVPTDLKAATVPKLATDSAERTPCTSTLSRKEQLHDQRRT